MFRTLNHFIICCAVSGLLLSHTPLLRANDDGNSDDPVQAARSNFTIEELEDLYEWLSELFGDTDDEDEEEDEGEGDDLDEENHEEFEDEAFDDEEFEDEDFEDEESDDEDFEDEDLNDEDFDDEELDDEEFDDEEFGDDDLDDEGFEGSESCEFDEEQPETDASDDESDEEAETGTDDADEFEDDAFEDSEFDDECSTFGSVTPGAGFGYVNPNPLPDNTIHPVSTSDANRAARFLTQATMGANYPMITQVASQGEETWLEDQFNQPVGLTRPYADFLANRLEQIFNEGGDEAVDAAFEELGVPESYFGYVWWTQGITSTDPVRQRVATALSEIFVIGRTVEEIGENPVALSTYYDVLLNNAFGNFRDLLLDVTMNPSMGLYLSHFENAKADPGRGTFPDENYAREVMQLFSIGLFELNRDGTRKLDSNGNPIPTYNNDDIREFAKVFTGLGNGGDEPSFEGVERGDLDTSKPMAMYESHHDATEKVLLNGTVLPAGQSGLQDIYGAIDNLFNHPNVGPFIGRLLIQRLVTSNPSPDYVERVAIAFEGDATTPRGDMKAVIRAILLDPEATNPPELASARQGKLREPMLRAMHLMRAFNATSHDRTFNGTAYTLTETTKQFIFASPSVFNFFQPDYAPLGDISQQGLVAPEFQITSASSIIGIKNYLSFALGEDGPMDEELGASVVSLDLTPELSMTDDELLTRLDTKLTYGTLTPSTRATVAEAIANLEGEQKVRTAIFLIMISPDYTTAI